MSSGFDIVPPDLGIEERARAGDWDAVADYVEDGGPITAKLRGFLADRLRGLKRDRGRPARTQQQEIAELNVVWAVRSFQLEEVLLRGTERSLSVAKKRYLDFRMCKGEPMSDKTLATYLSRHGGLSEKELRALEEIRAELIQEGLLRPPQKSRRART